MPQWVEPMPSLICVNSKVFTSHTHLVLHQVKLSTLMPLSKREVNVRLYIEEVGVDLELAFMPMDTVYNLSWKLLVKTNYPLVIGSSCIRGSIIYDRGFRPCSSLNTISRGSLSTCLL